MTDPPGAPCDAVETDIPLRVDRLPWSRFHTLVITALGITWILDGLEVTVAGSIAGALQSSPVLHFSAREVGLLGSAYLAGAASGALVFGYLTDRLGRRPLFMVTLGTYLVATALTAASWNIASFVVFRFLTGGGIGGEYAAINSAIQEFVPARFRGRVDLAVNGSFWVGAALGALGAVVFLQPGALPDDVGWRAAFGIGAVLGLGILGLRRFVPESPRCGGRLRLVTASRLSTVRTTAAIAEEYPSRVVLGLVLMAAQAFFYNAIFFSYALVLERFYQVPPQSVGWYVLPFAAGNFLGPLILGPLFDTIGRKRMIVLTYALSGVLLAGVGDLFQLDLVGAAGLTACWSAIFFFGSAAASAAYLTVGESFPLEARALAIAFFYAAGTAVGGIVSPALFGSLVGSGERGAVLEGYLLGAGLMIAAAVIALGFGINAERQPLEAVARPLSAK